MKRNGLFMVVVIASAMLLTALVGHTAPAAQAGKGSDGNKGTKCCPAAPEAKCCSHAPKAMCCGVVREQKCCAEGATKQCCPAGSKDKCCGGNSRAKCCSKNSQGTCSALGGCCAKKVQSQCCSAAGKDGCGPQEGAGKCTATEAQGPSGPKAAQSAAGKSRTGQSQTEPSANKGLEQDSPELAKAVERLKRIGYSDDDIAVLPASAILASAGAGNVVAFADLKPGETVVDLGCGDGIDCLLAGTKVGTCGKVIGVDMSPKRIAAANKNKRLAGLKNVEFRQGRLEKLPLDDASIDVAISNCVGIVMRGDAAVLSEAARVLKPGGRLVTTGRLKDEYVAKLRDAEFTTVESPAAHIVVAKKAQ